MKICPECQAEYDDFAVHCVNDGKSLLFIDDSKEEEKVDPLCGALLTDRVRIDNKIGEGGMGAVYKGEDTLLGRTVAVKILHPEFKKNIDDVKRFFNEAKVTAKLRHPNTIRVFDFGESKLGHNYIVMEFMTGEPLEDYMNNEELTVGRIIEVVDQVCQALGEAHNENIIHRDLKPDNIFIDTVNNRRIVKVIDFGIAKIVGGENLTQAGMVFGTPAYMSPEQARGENLDPRSDIYSVGVMLWHLLAGRQPFIGDNPMEVAIQHVTSEPPPLEEHSRFGVLPGELVTLVKLMMAKKREERPTTTEDIRTALMSIARLIPDLRVATSTQVGSAIQVRTSSVSTVGTREEIAPGLEIPDTSEKIVEEPETEFKKKGLGGIIFLAILLIAVSAAGGYFFLVVKPANADQLTNDPTLPEHSEISAENTENTENTETSSSENSNSIESMIPQAQFPIERALFRAKSAAETQRVTLVIQSNPAGAEIVRTDTNTSLGITPFTWYTRRSEETIELSLSSDGHQTAELSLSLTMNTTQNVELESERSRERSSRRERSEERGRSRSEERGRSEEREPEERNEAPEPEEEPEEERTSPGRFAPRAPITIEN